MVRLRVRLRMGRQAARRAPWRRWWRRGASCAALCSRAALPAAAACGAHSVDLSDGLSAHAVSPMLGYQSTLAACCTCPGNEPGRRQGRWCFLHASSSQAADAHQDS